MAGIIFYIFYGVNWVMTLLPLRVLYIISDFLFLILYYFPSYRRKVVSTNLRNSFPDKSDKELRIIEKKFYRHLADLFIETLKLTHISKAELLRRFKITNLHIIEKLHREKRDVIAVMAHYNNWEWLVCFPLMTDLKPISVYKPLKNKYFNKFINDLRLTYDMVLVPMSQIVREIITDRKNGENLVAAFISDQTPAKGDIKYWTEFLNQDTPVFLGVEKIASKFDMAVVYFNLQKIERGYYNLSIELLFEHTAGLPEHLITDTHVRRLEEIIREKPEYWIWTHKRWKHKRPANND